MKKFIYLFLLSLHIGYIGQSCELPRPYSAINTGSNMTMMLTAPFISSLVILTDDPYIVAQTDQGMVIGSSSIATDSLLNGMKSIAVWGDDILTPDTVEAALEGESFSLVLVDGTNLVGLGLNSFTYATNGMVVVSSSAIQSLECEGYINGCTDQSACNFDVLATQNDGSCEYPDPYYDCNQECLTDTDSDGVCDELEVVGCLEPMACNYHQSATEAGDCTYANPNNCESCTGETDGSATVINHDKNEDGICEGCTDIEAMNYLPFATEDDGSCAYVHLDELASSVFEIYPNPSFGKFVIKSTGDFRKIEVKMISVLGTLISHRSYQNVQSNDEISMHVSNLSAGFYTLVISTPSNIVKIPWVKK